MSEAAKCAHCREEIGEHPVEWKGKLYCCQVCAFETSKRIGSICGARESVETSLRFYHKPEKKAG